MSPEILELNDDDVIILEVQYFFHVISFQNEIETDYGVEQKQTML